MSKTVPIDIQAVAVTEIRESNTPPRHEVCAYRFQLMNVRDDIDSRKNFVFVFFQLITSIFHQQTSRDNIKL